MPSTAVVLTIAMAIVMVASLGMLFMDSAKVRIISLGMFVVALVANYTVIRMLDNVHQAMVYWSVIGVGILYAAIYLGTVCRGIRALATAAVSRDND